MCYVKQTNVLFANFNKQIYLAMRLKTVFSIKHC